MIQVTFPNGMDSVIVYGLTQWDYGQTLSISGITLADGTQVHFANSAVEKAIVKTITGGVVEVPDELLEQPFNITAWVYEIGSNEGETLEGETIKTISLPVSKRTKPADFISVEQSKLPAMLLKNAVKLMYTWDGATNLPAHINIDTDAISVNNAFHKASGVEILIINAPNVTNGAGSISASPTLKSAKLKFSDNCTDLSNIADGSSNLEKLKIDFSTSHVMTFPWAFRNCSKLATIEGALDFTSITYSSNVNSMFSGTALLKDVEFVEETINVALTISSALLTNESLISLIIGLKDRSDTTSLKLTIGTANIDKLATIEGALDAITEKNWIIN